MRSSGTSTRTSPGEMSRVATHPRPVRGNRPMVTPCSSTPRRRIQSRYARSVAVCSGLGRCSSGAAAFPREVSAGGFWSCEASRAPRGGAEGLRFPSTSRQPDDATRTPDELGTSKRLARVCSRDANQLAFRSRAGSEGKAAGFTTRADGVRSMLVIGARRAPVRVR